MTRKWPAGLLLAYPPDWRERYGDELEMLVRDLREHGRNPVPMAVDLLRGAAAAWCGAKRGFMMSERSRQALITVLWSWVAFAATAAWFGHDLGIYPTRSIAQKIASAHQVVPDAYHVLIGVGVVGIAATVVAACRSRSRLADTPGRTGGIRSSRSWPCRRWQPASGSVAFSSSAARTPPRR